MNIVKSGIQSSGSGTINTTISVAGQTTVPAVYTATCEKYSESFSSKTGEYIPPQRRVSRLYSEPISQGYVKPIYTENLSL